MMQSGGPEIRGPAVVEAGSNLEIEVQGNVKEIEVSLNGDATSTKYSVGADGKVSIPVPANSAGRFVLVTTVGAPPPGVLSVEIVSLD